MVHSFVYGIASSDDTGDIWKRYAITSTGLLVDQRDVMWHRRGSVSYARSTNVSTTRFWPALSNWIVSLLPSTAATLP